MDALPNQPGRPTAGIPPLGSVAQRWLSLRSVEDPALDDALALLSNDAVIHEPVLAWCRHGAGVAAPRVTTPHRAVIVLGLPGVRAAVVGVSALVALNAVQDARAGIDLSGFWTHALAVAGVSEMIAPEIGLEPDLAFLAGLLHDAGKAVLAADMPGAFSQAMELGEQRGRSAAGALREVLGIDHYTAGKRLCEAWSLPGPVRDAVWLHDQPAEAMPVSADRKLAALVSLAKSWARTNHLGWSGEFGPVPDPVELCRRVGLEPSRLSEITEACLQGVRERARAVGYGGDGGADPLAWSAAAASRRSNELSSRLRDLTRESESNRVVLQAIRQFRAGVGRGDRASDVVGQIGRSACSVLGVGRVALVWQTDQNADWSLSLVSAEGVSEKSRIVERPPDGAQIRRPAELADAHAAQVLIACELGWLARLLNHLREAGTPALVGAGASSEQPGASCLVLAPVARLQADRVALGPLTDLWAWALEAAARAEYAARMGEELALANRTLAATRDELASKQSLLRLGQMAAGAAHELNNPLTVIRGRAQLIREKASTPRQREDAEAIAEAAQQVSDMISSMHLLSTPPRQKPTDCDPMLILRDAIDRARTRVPLEAQKSRVRINSDGVNSSMRIDAELAAQALSEPIANAMLARPGAEVHISIESEAFTDRLRVRVMDRGPGLSAKALIHAFDPFFSEQPAGRRAGLGLARARSIVELMGGDIEIANNPGDIGGAYAEIVLPEAKVQKRAA